MRVSICDDLPEAIDDLKEKLSHFPDITAIDTFTDLNEFAKRIKKVKYDICFMDIDWGKDVQDGLVFAEKLKGIPIIFVTAYPLEYAEKLFGQSYNPCGFLIKPAKEEQIAILLEKVKKEWQFRALMIPLSINGNVHMTKATEVVYLEGVLHKTKVYLRNNEELIVNKSLTELSRFLPGYFLFCHKSFVVNPQYVVLQKADRVQLSNGITVSVSRSKREETKEHYMEFLENVGMK